MKGPAFFLFAGMAFAAPCYAADDGGTWIDSVVARILQWDPARQAQPAADKPDAQAAASASSVFPPPPDQGLPGGLCSVRGTGNIICEAK